LRVRWALFATTLKADLKANILTRNETVGNELYKHGTSK
jgi:hypothetical protein